MFDSGTTRYHERRVELIKLWYEGLSEELRGRSAQLVGLRRRQWPLGTAGALHLKFTVVKPQFHISHSHKLSRNVGTEQYCRPPEERIEFLPKEGGVSLISP